MVHVMRYLEIFAAEVANGAAVVIFLLAGLIGVTALDRKVTRSIAPEPAQASADLPELLHRFYFSLKSYARGLLTENPGRFLPWLASILSAACGIIAFAALTFAPGVGLADLNVGLIFIFGMSFLGIFVGVLARGFSVCATSLAGLARNSMRLASFEAAAALALISGVILAGSISIKHIVEAQSEQGAWLVFLAPLGFLLYLAASIAGIDSAARPSIRAPAPQVPGELEEAAKFRWPFGSLGTSIHLLIGAGLATTVFWGGWLRPFASYHDHFAGTSVELLDLLPPLVMASACAYCYWTASRESDRARKQLTQIAGEICAGMFVVFTGVLFAPAAALEAVDGAFWFLAKMAVYLYLFLWVRGRIPQYRFGRPIRAAWNFLIPLAAINLAGVAAAQVARERWDWSPALSTLLMTAIALGMAAWLGLNDASESQNYGLEP